MTSNTITHLELKCPDGNKHYYYGCMASIFAQWNPGDIGVTLRKLWEHKLSPSHPYENDRVIIRQGTIVRKSQRPHATFDPFK